MNALEIKNLCKSYGGFCLDNLNLTLPGGCILGLIGENGAGKSTVIKCILDIVHKDSGNINVLGRDNQLSFELTKEDIGAVLDRNCFPNSLNAVKISKIMSCAYKNWDAPLFFSYLDIFNVPKTKRIKTLSRGMAVKLSIAVALSHNAKLLILDEPMNGLDPVARDEITDLLIEFTRDETHSVLISSHIIENLEKMCDYIAFLHKGRLLLCEEKDTLKEKYCNIHITNEQYNSLNPSAVIGMRDTKYGIEAVALRNELPDDLEKFPVSIEDLFIVMAKGENI